MYASWGALGTITQEMFAFPGHLRNYYLAVVQPPPLAWGALLCSVAIACSGLLLLSRRWVLAGAVLLPTAALAAFLLHSISGWAEFGVHIALSGPVLPACVAYAALAVLARYLVAIPTAAEQRWLEAVVAILFFQLMMSFQIFPRATYNVAGVLYGNHGVATVRQLRPRCYLDAVPWL